MDTIQKIKGAIIVDIIKVVLDNILLELHFNVEHLTDKFSFKLNISDDGETILFSKNEKWTISNDLGYEAFSVIKVHIDKDELSKLLGTEILNIQFGIGKPLDIDKEVIYYIKIDTNKNEFLFFNNGDEGAYSFDKVKLILDNDIYGYEWSFIPPLDSLRQ
jgi:hypothetical protein